MLNKTVRSLLELQPVAGDFGVEIEMEGSPGIVEVDNWVPTRDGSLRGSGALEYVLRKPLYKKQALETVTNLYKAIKDNGGKINNSMRAGVHIHMNCQKMTIRQLATLICVYYVFEEVLTDRFGDDRVGNLFCLRLIDAEYVNSCLYRAFVNEDLSFLQNDSIRYAALNLNALARYGSLEFRAQQTPTKPGPILEWIELLDQLKTSIDKFQDPQDVLGSFSAGGVENSIDIVFEGLSSKIREVSNYEEKIIEGIRTSQLWVYSRNWS